MECGFLLKPSLIRLSSTLVRIWRYITYQFLYPLIHLVFFFFFLVHIFSFYLFILLWLQILTNGIYRSIVHRATVNSEKARLSFATFYSMKLDGEMGPAPSLITPETPALFKKISFVAYTKGFLSRKLQEKSNVDFMRIENEDSKSYWTLEYAYRGKWIKVELYSVNNNNIHVISIICNNLSGSHGMKFNNLWCYF